MDLKPIAGLAVMLVASLSAQRLSPIRVEPRTPTVNVGASVALRAVDDNGQVVAAKWAISDPLVATVSAQGVLTGRNPGRAVVQARSKNSRAETTVTVRAIELPVPPPPADNDSEPLLHRLVSLAARAVSGPQHEQLRCEQSR